MNLSNWRLGLLTLSILVSNILAVVVASLVGLLVISGAFFLGFEGTGQSARFRS